MSENSESFCSIISIGQDCKNNSFSRSIDPYAFLSLENFQDKGSMVTILSTRSYKSLNSRNKNPNDITSTKCNCLLF